MKRILLIIMAIAAITFSASAQGLADIKSWEWVGGPGKSYVDKATLDSRAENFNSIINDSNSDIKLCIRRKDDRKAWYSFNGGVHFMAFYEEAITASEKKLLDKENPGWNNKGDNSANSSKKKKKKFMK